MNSREIKSDHPSSNKQATCPGRQTIDHLTKQVNVLWPICSLICEQVLKHFSSKQPHLKKKIVHTLTMVLGLSNFTSALLMLDLVQFNGGIDGRHRGDFWKMRHSGHPIINTLCIMLLRKNSRFRPQANDFYFVYEIACGTLLPFPRVDLKRLKQTKAAFLLKKRYPRFRAYKFVT